MKPLRIGALFGILLFLQVGICLTVLAVLAGLSWTLPASLEPLLGWCWMPALPGDLPGGLRLSLGELAFGGGALWLSAVLPVLWMRQLLAEEARGPRRPVLFLGAAWSAVILGLWVLHRFWLEDWQHAFLMAALQGLRREWGGTRTTLSGAGMSAALFLGWSGGWALHLSRRLSSREADGLFRKLRTWGRRAALGVLLLGLGLWPANLWWARHCARQEQAVLQAMRPAPTPYGVLSEVADSREPLLPWGGFRDSWGRRQPLRWWPRRAYREFFNLLTGQDLPDDPWAWRAWLKAHPDLVWDPVQGRFVEPPAKGEGP